MKRFDDVDYRVEIRANPYLFSGCKQSSLRREALTSDIIDLDKDVFNKILICDCNCLLTNFMKPQVGLKICKLYLEM